MATVLRVMAWVDLGVFFLLGTVGYILATFVLKHWGKAATGNAYKSYIFAQTPVHLTAIAAFVISFVSGLRLLGYDSLIELIDADATGEVLGVQAYDLLWLSVGLAMWFINWGLTQFFAVGPVETAVHLIIFGGWVILNVILARADSIYAVIFISAFGFLLVVGSFVNLFRITPVRLMPINGWVMSPAVFYVLGLVAMWVFTILVNPYMQLASSTVVITTVQIIFSCVMFAIISVLTFLFTYAMKYRSPYDGMWESLYPSNSRLLPARKVNSQVQNQ